MHFLFCTFVRLHIIHFFDFLLLLFKKLESRILYLITSSSRGIFILIKNGIEKFKDGHFFNSILKLFVLKFFCFILFDIDFINHLKLESSIHFLIKLIICFSFLGEKNCIGIVCGTQRSFLKCGKGELLPYFSFFRIGEVLYYFLCFSFFFFLF